MLLRATSGTDGAGPLPGTEIKIDASYLSPHVNMSSRLEAATKQYGVEILISEDVVRLLSAPLRDLCRMIDRVTVKGSSRPTCLYTYDVPPHPSEDVDACDVSLSAEEFFSKVPPDRSEEFRAMFFSALANYLGGENGERADWEQAAYELQECLVLCPADGPSQALLDYIRKKGVHRRAPPSWEGYRPLEDK